MHCVLLDKDMVTVLDEHDVECPRQACYSSFTTPDETDVVSTTSTADTTDDAIDGTYCVVQVLLCAVTDNLES